LRCSCGVHGVRFLTHIGAALPRRNLTLLTQCSIPLRAGPLVLRVSVPAALPGRKITPGALRPISLEPEPEECDNHHRESNAGDAMIWPKAGEVRLDSGEARGIG